MATKSKNNRGSNGSSSTPVLHFEHIERQESNVSILQRGVTQASKYESALRMLLMCLESRPDERPRATNFH